MIAPRFPWLAAAVVAAVCFANGVHDVDLFWQVSFGELMIAKGGPIVQEPFYPDAIGRPIIPIYGLAQLYDARIVRIGGFDLLKILDALMWALAMALPAWQAGKRWGRPCWLAVLLGFIPASVFYMLRPQSFALLGAALLLGVLLSRRSNLWKIVSGVLVMLVWQNAHPSVIVGGLILLPFVVAGWWHALRGEGPKPWAETILLALVPLLMIATPAGTQVFELMRINTERVAQFGVNEWLPIYDLSNIGISTRGIIGILLGTAAIIVNLRQWRREPADRDGRLALIFLVLGFMVLTVVSHRFVLFLGLVCPLMFVRVRSPLTQPPLPSWPALAVFLAVMALGTFWIKTGKLPVINNWFPVEAAKALAKEKPAGPIFVTTEWGGLLAYYGMQPLMDGRYFARTKDECTWYRSALAGDISIEEIERHWHPVAFFLTPGCTDLIDLLKRHPDWRMIDCDPNQAFVFVKRRS